MKSLYLTMSLQSYRRKCNIENIVQNLNNIWIFLFWQKCSSNPTPTFSKKYLYLCAISGKTFKLQAWHFQESTQKHKAQLWAERNTDTLKCTHKTMPLKSHWDHHRGVKWSFNACFPAVFELEICNILAFFSYYTCIYFLCLYKFFGNLQFKTNDYDKQPYVYFSNQCFTVCHTRE